MAPPLAACSRPVGLASRGAQRPAHPRSGALLSAPAAPSQARRLPLCRTSSAAAAPAPEEPEAQPAAAAEAPAAAAAAKEPAPPAAAPGEQPQQPGGVLAWLKGQQAKAVEGRAKLAALGLAAVLAYGLFDGVSYTIAFSIAFLGYEARTGLNPTQNIADLVKICILMWAGNNVTRPFRIAGAAALAPFMDKLMDKLQDKLGLPKKLYAFLLVVAIVAGACLSIVGTLFLSRWVRG